MKELRAVRSAWFLPAQKDGKKSHPTAWAPQAVASSWGHLTYCYWLSYMGRGWGQPGSLCFGCRKLSGREPELKVRTPAAEASPAMHLLRLLLPIPMPLCPVCMLPLEIYGPVLWPTNMFSLVGTHTLHTHVCLCVCGGGWHMCM